MRPGIGEENEPATSERVRPLVEWAAPDNQSRAASDRSGRREALIGGLILVVLGTIAGLRGVWQIFSVPDYPAGLAHAELNGLKVLGGQILLVLAAIFVALGALATRGGRRARFAVGVFALACGSLGLLAVATADPSGLVAIPFVVSAYFLLRAALRPVSGGQDPRTDGATPGNVHGAEGDPDADGGPARE